MADLIEAFHRLELPSDSAQFTSIIQTLRINTSFRLNPDEIEILLTQETVRSTTELVLLVKKPDYLGNSRGEFKLGEHPIEAKMTDDEWLERFRNGHVILKPGYALKAVVKTETARGFEGNTVATRFEVLRVVAAIAPQGDAPGRLFG